MDRMDEFLEKQIVFNDNLLKMVQQKDAVGIHAATPLHGLTGIFSGAGIENPVVSAYIRPAGLVGHLRRIPRRGETVEVAGLAIEVLEATERRASKLAIKPLTTRRGGPISDETAE